VPVTAHHSPGFARLQSILDGGGVVVIDGAMGTELERRGAPMDENAWSGLANLRDPGLVRAIHEDHIRAGADVVITNTFMSGLGPMQRAGLEERFEESNRNAISAARAAVESAAERPVAVAGSVSAISWGAPERDSDETSPREGYARQVEVLAGGGVDLIALEMVADTRLGQPAIDAALASGLPVWLGLSMKVAARNPSGSDSLPDIGSGEARTVSQATLRDRLHAVNVMHTDIDDVADAITMIRNLWPGPLGVYPHRGIWAQPHWVFVDVPPQQLSELAQTWLDLGATMLGGCCGLTSDHVAVLRDVADTFNRS
jgi:S-methylmethionine-dependent homocysteine/selenocysteine methylase